MNNRLNLDNYNYNNSPYSYMSSITPHIAMYHQDGKGRDSYIYLNNGGFTKSSPKVSNERDYGHFKLSRYYDLSINKASKRYDADGSGRDSYVTNGLTDSLGGGHIKLPNILRRNDASLSPKNLKRSFFTKKELEAKKELKFKESELINRIYYRNSPERTKRINQELGNNRLKLNHTNISLLNNIGDHNKLNILEIKNSPKFFRKDMTLPETEEEKPIILFSNRNQRNTRSNCDFDFDSFTNSLKMLSNYEGKSKKR